MVATIIFFTLAVWIKGGILKRNVAFKAFSDKSGFTNFICDGVKISSIAVGCFAAHYTNAATGVLFGLAWWIGWMSSIGEEIGAIGQLEKLYIHFLKEKPFVLVSSIQKNWGEYVGWMGVSEARAFGWKKGLQRGVYLGALLALPTNCGAFIIAGASFPLIYYLGNSLFFLIHKRDSWFYAEPLYGTVLGIGAYAWVHNF